MDYWKFSFPNKDAFVAAIARSKRNTYPWMQLTKINGKIFDIRKIDGNTNSLLGVFTDEISEEDFNNLPSALEN